MDILPGRFAAPLENDQPGPGGNPFKNNVVTWPSG